MNSNGLPFLAQGYGTLSVHDLDRTQIIFEPTPESDFGIVMMTARPELLAKVQAHVASPAALRSVYILYVNYGGDSRLLRFDTNSSPDIGSVPSRVEAIYEKWDELLRRLAD